ncbi:hypothetical protein LWI28_012035 [Acer negundo]|uniref:Uncharacterized protein n=1 Tax=Acer negundo TaxID=4023 RepID=A0AAD5P091_ACENE|nr:hypothetical protein LWI28_012035 [Acer negundo]
MASKAQSGLGSQSSAKAVNENKGGRSFAEVVAGNQKDEFLTVDWHPQQYEQEWLKKCTKLLWTPTKKIRLYLGLQKKFERDIVVLKSEKVNQGKERKELAKVSCAEASLVSNQEDKALSFFKSSKGGRENQDINRLDNVCGMKSCSVFEGSLME